MIPVNQPDLLAPLRHPPDCPAAPAYVVPHAIAVNTLRKTLALLSAADRWPWDPDMKTARMERTVPKLLAVLPPEEADDWRERIGAEVVRLDAIA
jgi:hypothetical protein